MPEPEDELTRLGRADPVDPASAPSSTDTRAQALFQEITMTDATPPSADTPSSPAFRSKPVARVVMAAALVLLAGIVGAVVLSRTGSDDPDPAGETAAGEPEDGPITPGGASSASCVEVYDLDTLAHREIAFDGEGQAVDGDRVTLVVNEWYRGGDTPTVTLDGATGLAGLTSAGPATGLEPGTRLLVAGDGGFAWSCGFTQPYDEGVAEEWRQALGVD